MPKNQLKRHKGTVVETVYVRKTSSRGDVKIVAKQHPRPFSAHPHQKTRMVSQPADDEQVDIPLEHQKTQHCQATHKGKVC